MGSTTTEQVWEFETQTAVSYGIYATSHSNAYGEPYIDITVQMVA